MLATSDPDRIDIAFDDHRLVADAGLLLPATLAQHLGLQELADSYLDLGDAPGRGERRRQAADPGRLGARGRRVHRRRRCVARRRDGERARLHRQGAVHPRDSSCAASAGATSASSTASAASCSPAAGRPERDQARRRSRSTSTRRSARPTAWRKRAPGSTATRACAAMHPLRAVAAGTGDVLMARLREGRANTARGAAHFLREHRWARVQRCRSERAAHGARRQRLLQPRRRRRLPQAGCPLLNHHSPAAERTPADRGDSGRGLDCRSRTGCRAARMSPRRPTRRSSTRRMPPRCGSSCGASSRRPAHSSRSS